LFGQLGVKASFGECSDHGLHSVRQAAVIVGGKELGVIGEVHPDVLARFEIAGVAYLFELDLPVLVPFMAGDKVFRPLPRFPAVVRDIALVLDAGIAHQRVVDIIKSFPLVAGVAIFDVYSGEQVPAGKKSLAYRITFQSPTQTLTDSEVNAVQQRILERLEKELGVGLRG